MRNLTETSTAIDSPSATLAPDPNIRATSRAVYVGMEFDGIHAVIKEAENLLYDMLDGEPAYVIKKKSTGIRCTNCWSPDRQQRTLSHCPVCKGSGFIDGYYKPISIQIAFDSTPRKSDSQKNFEDVYTTMRARTSNYPIIRPKDIIVNADQFKRYVVTYVETTKLPRHAQPTGEHRLSGQNYVISQLLSLQELNPDDNEYQIPI
jgi:hypothetical protein